MSILKVPEKWDHEADVIIVGGGTAGLPAAVVVAESGLKASILEAGAQCGGSFNMVAGCFAIAGSDEQKEADIDDSSEIYYQDLVNVCGVEPELARAFANTQLDTYRMIKEEGVKFNELLPPPGHSRVRGLGCSGIGPKMVKALENRARRVGVQILCKHKATRLITQPQTGRVIGLMVDVKGEMKNFKAKKAVILASGGFGRNREMIAEYAPDMVDAIPKMPAAHRGDGLKMGLELGAATKDIGKAVAPAWPVCSSTHSCALWPLNLGGIAVNVDGDRFFDESCKEGFYGPLTGAGMKQPGGVYWVIYDDKILEKVNKIEYWRNTIEKCKKYKANGIEELAKSAGINVKGLSETIEKYNNDVATSGYDSVLGRKAQLGNQGALVQITPPLFAVKCVTSITSMKGGLKINASTQVLNQYGEIIPGLYAAGEVTGGLHTKTYLLGIMSAGSATLGVIAGRNSAKELDWQ